MSSKLYERKSKVGESLLEQQHKTRVNPWMVLGALIGVGFAYLFAWGWLAFALSVAIGSVVGYLTPLAIAMGFKTSTAVFPQPAPQALSPSKTPIADTMFAGLDASLDPQSSFIQDRRLPMFLLGALLGTALAIYFAFSLASALLCLCVGGIAALGLYGRSLFHVSQEPQSLENEKGFLLDPPELPLLSKEQRARQDELYAQARQVYNEVEHLVISGGGGRGIGLIAGLEQAAEAGLDLTRLKSCVGTSVGTMLAIAVAINLDLDELRTTFNTLPLSTFKDWGWWSPVRLFSKWGFFRNRGLSEHMHKVIKDKTGLDDPTFAELRAAGGKDLKIIVGNLTEGRPEVFSADTTPDESIVFASTKSMAVPFVYQPRTGLNKHLYVDGGLFLNYGIRIVPNDALSKKTLGFLLMGDSTSASLIDQTPANVDSFYSYGKRLLSCLLLQQVSSLTEEQWAATAVVNTGDYPLMDFTPNHEKRQQLEDNARDAIEEHIERSMLRRVREKYSRTSALVYLEELKSEATSVSYKGDLCTLKFSHKEPDAQTKAQAAIEYFGHTFLKDKALHFEDLKGNHIISLPRDLQGPDAPPQSPRGQHFAGPRLIRI